MKKWLIICLLVITGVPGTIWAQQDSSYAIKVNQYINQYKDLAMIEQMHCGMPASIILAQAILETEAGTSELVKGANNHFGIKCKSNWTGATFTHTDDEADECFRKYRSVAESYKDHSDYLKNTPRYASLFKLSVTDYAGWALGLKQCGYATNPIYSQKLIGLIEDYHLQQYTYQVLNDGSDAKNAPIKENVSPKPAIAKSTPQIDTFAFKKKAKTVADTTQQKPMSTYSSYVADTIPKKNVAKTLEASKDSIPVIKDTLTKTDSAANKIPVNINSSPAASPITSTPVKSGEEPRVVIFHEHKAIFVHKGDMLLEYATKHNIRYAKLLEMNDMPDAPVEADMYIYLEKKNASGTHPYHIVQEAETIHMVSQTECMQLKRLMSFNHLEAGQEPVPGTKLYLQDEAPKKVIIVTAGIIKKPTPADSTNIKKEQAPDTYISTTSPDAAQNIPVTSADNTGDFPVAAGDAANSKNEIDHEKLVKLKAKLDKVVYSNDNNTSATPAQSPADIISEMAGPAQKTIAKPTADSSKYYTVKSGDTVYSIAHRFSISIQKLNYWNNLDDVAIKVGMKLKVKE